MTRVLIFESDHAFAVELRTELSALGCTVQVFKEGTTGLSAALQSPPDVAIVSADLRPMNGFSICNKLKKDPALCRVPVLLLSADQAHETFQQHMKLPSRANDYVRKPIAVPDLVARIRAWVPLGSMPALGVGAIPGATRPRPSYRPPGASPAADGKTKDILPFGLNEEDDAEATHLDPGGQANVWTASVVPSPPRPPSRPPPRLALPSNPAPPSPVPMGRGTSGTTQVMVDPRGVGAPESSRPELEEATFHAPGSSQIASSARAGSSVVPPAIDLPGSKDPGRSSNPTPALAPSIRPAADFGPRSYTVVSGAVGDPEETEHDESSAVTAAHYVIDPHRFEAPPQTVPAPLLEGDAVAPSSTSDHEFEVPSTQDSSPGPEPSSVSLRQLRQALVQAHQELQRMRPQVNELARTRAELADARRELAVAREAGRNVAESEYGDLRDRLARREGELLALREEVSERHREVDQARAASATLRSEVVETRERSLHLEQAAAEATARLDALQAEKALVDATVGDLKESARRLAEQVHRGSVDLAELRAKHETELARLASEHAEETRRVEERTRTVLAAGDEAHAAALAALEARLEAAQREADGLRRELEAHVEAARAGAGVEWETRLAELTRQARNELATLEQRHAGELARQEAEHSAALERLRYEHASTLQRSSERSAEQAAALQQQLTTARLDAEAQARHAEGLYDQLGHSEKLRRDQAVRTASLEGELRRARDDADEALRRADAFDAEKASWSLAWEDARRTREELEARLAMVDESRETAIASAVERTLAAREEQRAAELEAIESLRRSEREELEGQLVRLRGELQTAQAGLQRARERWGEDRVALQKARDAISALIAASEPDDG